MSLYNQTCIPAAVATPRDLSHVLTPELFASSAGLRSAGARTFMASARRMGAVAEPDFDFNTFSQEATSSEAR